MACVAVKATFIVVLFFVTTVKTDEGKGFKEVTFSKKSVTVKCGDSWKVHEVNGKVHSSEYTFEYQRPVQYMCKTDGKKPYHVYIKGRACENCFEMNGTFFLAVILVDLFGTAIVMMIIYRCSKKKTSGIPSKPTKTTPKTGSRGPPAQSPYESLNHFTKSSDTYSTVTTGMLNRTG